MSEERTDEAAAAALTRGVPVAALQAARKELANQVKTVVAAAQELEQLALLDEVPFEEALTLPVEEVRKRYTAENSRQIEWRREACVKMLARQISAPDIGDILKMNPRTVAAIAAQEGQKIAGHADSIADALASSAMADFALAETKKHEASYAQLQVGGGIKLTHYANLKLLGAAGNTDSAAHDLEAENPLLEKAKRFLEMQNEKLKIQKVETKVIEA